MYDLQKSDLSKRVQYNIKAATTFETEGILATAVNDGTGNEVVQPSGAGGATEYVVGFALLTTESITEEVKYEQITIPSVAPYTVQLQSSNPIILASTLAEANVVQSDGTQFTQIAVPVATTQYNISATGLITFDPAGSDAGKVVNVYVRDQLTANEAVMKFGQSNVNNNFQTLNNLQIACGKGRIFTMEYDVSQVYTIGGNLYTHNTLANGQVTSDVTSGKIVGRCCQVPDSSTRYLGVDFNI